MTLPQIKQLLDKARCPEEVFGTTDPQARYRELIKLSHPDKHPAASSVEAAAVFTSLTAQWALADHKMVAHTYGDMKPTVKLVVRWKGGEARVTGVLRKDALFQHLEAEVDGQPRRLKVPFPAYRSFCDSEATAITAMNAVIVDEPHTWQTCPRLKGTFKMPLGKGVQVPALILQDVPDNGMFSLEQVIKAYPNGIDPRDAAWMVNRLLGLTMSMATAGYVHCGLNPASVRINPEHHMVEVQDWHSAVKLGEKCKVADQKWKACVPPEVLAKESTTSVTDLFSIASIGCWLMNGDTYGKGSGTRPPVGLDRRLTGLFNAALLPNPKSRPFINAEEFFFDYRTALREVYGARQFRPFSIPQ